ncbi:WXG100 family type VII secretion target [Streptomyces sp. NPDC048255]|uniref:WXG100 family type VII secretion target n=1 Tax=Streptomyces sp. NPDC048255 TaxID=3154713 RepID=UPI0033F15996
MATKFEGYTHAELYAMVAAIDPEAVRTRAKQLADAATTIKEIGDELKKRKVKGWEGEAADAFAEWADKMGSATLRLAEYSAAGGKQMTEAAQIMTEVKPDPSGAKGDMPQYNPIAEAALKANVQTPRGMDAVAKLNADHARAVDAMNKLAGRYDLSSKEMDKAPVPTFPPPPEVLVPEMVSGREDMAREGGSSGTGSYSGGSYYGSSASDGSGSVKEPGRTPGSPPHAETTVPPTGSVPLPPVGIPERDVDVNIDSVIAPQNPTLPPTTGLPTGPMPGGPGPALPTPGPFVPPMTLPPVSNVKAPGLPGPGIGPLQGPPGTGGKFTGTPGLPPRDSGIMGGKPVTPNGPGPGIPRGTVIGTEGQHTGRGMGGGMGPGVGGPHGGQSGSPVGRRLATEQGGIVGGRQSGTAGVAGRPVAGAQPFTQGGSGLVRNNRGGAGAGAMGHAGAGVGAPGQRREDQGGERPDYLAEDEETWQSNRRVVPPVID